MERGFDIEAFPQPGSHQPHRLRRPSESDPVISHDIIDMDDGHKYPQPGSFQPHRLRRPSETDPVISHDRIDMDDGHKYPNTLMQDLNNLEDKQLYDVKFAVGGKTLHAHRAVLAASCQYFWTMFASGFKETSSSTILWKYGSAETFEIMLEFVYSGKLDDEKLNQRMVDALDLACFLQYSEFILKTSKYIRQLFESEPHKICVKEAWKIHLLSKDHCLKELLEASLKYLDDNVESLKNLNIFLEGASVTFLQEFLCREDLSSEDEETQVLELVSNWLKHNWTERNIYADQLLQNIRLGLVALHNIREQLGPDIMGIKEFSDSVKHVLQLQASDTPRDTLLFENPNLFMARSAITAPVVSREYSNFEYYNQKARCWMNMEKMDPFPKKNKSVSILGVNGKLYAAGGFNNEPEEIYQGKRNFYTYSVWFNKWEALQPMSTGRLYFPLVYMDGYIYAIGGLLDEIQCTATNKVERYDMARNTWEDIAPLPRTCHRLSAVVFGGNIVVYGMKMVFENPTISEHFVMIYQSGRTTWHVTDLTSQEDFQSWKFSLFCHRNKCYRIMFKATGLVSVNALDLRDDAVGGTVTAAIGEEIPQHHMPPNRRAFRIDDEVFLLINRLVFNTEIRIGSDQSGHVEIGSWNRSSYLRSETSNVTLFTFDRKKLSNGDCLKQYESLK